MSIFQLLTYNIKEHNIVWFKVPFIDNGDLFWRRLYSDFKSWIKFLLHFNYHFEELPKLNDVVFVYATDNNHRALEPIYSKLPSSLYSVLDLRKKNSFYPSVKYRHYAMLYLVNLINMYCFSSKKEKRIIANHYNDIMPTIGLLKCTEDIFHASSNIKLIVLANDHSPVQRSIIHLAPKYGVKTLYTQHCSVGYHFPSLQFSYSFLDGEETYEKYKDIGDMKGVIYISGNPRFDKIAEYKQYKVPSDIIGIATTFSDDEDVVRQLCESLIELGYKLCIRPHPGQTLLYEDWYQTKGIQVSNPKTETPFEFATRMKIIIAGETGIHFDAAMMGIRSICYRFDGKPLRDNYSYVKNGLITYARSEQELKIFLCQPGNYHYNNNLLCWYNAAYGTKHEGHIGEQIRDFIVYSLNNQLSLFDTKYDYYTQDSNVLYEKKVYNYD